MPESSLEAASGSEVGVSSSASTALEAQLAFAEKKVSMVMNAFKYDELITIASEALAIPVKLTTPSKAVIKSRKNLLWARSHSYHHKGLHALALKDARAALKLDPDDPSSYLRTAGMLHDAGHKAQALACLDRASSLAESFKPSTKGICQRRIEKQRHKFSKPSAFHIDRLPNEVLIAIARHLPHRDRLTMSHICHHWRQLAISDPSLWQELIVAIKAKKFPEAKAARWLQHIRNFSSRANNALKSAVFLGFFPGGLLRTILGILRTSAHSLERISIPAYHHDECYKLLYRYCPNLKYLDAMNIEGINNDHNGLRALQRRGETSLPELQVQSFQLEGFRSDPNVPHPHLTAHLHRARYLFNYGPDGWDSETGEVHTEARQEQLELLLSLANNLEECRLVDDWPSHEFFNPRIPDRRFPPVTATFSKLTKLDGFLLNANFRFDFPELQVLEELHVLDEDPRAEARGFRRHDELVRMLKTCPNLRILKADFWQLDGEESNLFAALRGLHEIQELSLAADGRRNFVSKLLMPYTSEDVAGHRQVNSPCPNLLRLTIDATRLDVTKLAFVLLQRDLLRQGQGFDEARSKVRETLRAATNTSSAPAISPFQRASRTNLVPQVSPPVVGPRLADTTTMRALEFLRLYSLESVSTEVEQALRCLVPDLVLEYEQL
ncbi:uncharacterized protein UDID_03545 [Ustilago sp. UG-2017a]|nr:uncharacterized protein UDID_03545 [Ustilago sp. UG-2017a]